MNRKDWYARVNQAWPVGELPQLTAEEAIKSARRLFRWAGVPVPVCLVTSGNRNNWGVRNSWTPGGYDFRVNPEKGWRELVHGVAHWAHWLRTHGKSHARLELSMVRQVVKRGWLDGKLKQSRVAMPVAGTDADTGTSEKLEHARRMLAKAETRLKRATTIRRKWARKVARLERKVDKPPVAC